MCGVRALPVAFSSFRACSPLSTNISAWAWCIISTQRDNQCTQLVPGFLNGDWMRSEFWLRWKRKATCDHDSVELKNLVVANATWPITIRRTIPSKRLVLAALGKGFWIPQEWKNGQNLWEFQRRHLRLQRLIPELELYYPTLQNIACVEGYMVTFHICFREADLLQ